MKIMEQLHVRFGPRNWWPAETEFEVCVGAILTQNTAWTNVEKAIENIKSEKLMSLGKLRGAGISKVAELIKPSGYYNLKAKRLMSLLDYLSSLNGGDWLEYLRTEKLDRARESLLEVHGVGPETADSILLYAAGRLTFVVDKYTLRFGARYGLFGDDCKYEDARGYFMERLPRSAKVYNEYHAQLVALGNAYCRPRPLCIECPLLRSCHLGKKAQPTAG